MTERDRETPLVHDSTGSAPDAVHDVAPDDVAELLDRLMLRGIRLVRSSGETPPLASGDVAAVETHLEPARMRVDSSEVSLWYEHRVHCRDEEGGDLATIETGVVVDFDLTHGDEPELAVVACLADTNGIFIAWPYIRESVQSMSVRLGLAPITLGILRRDQDAYASDHGEP